MGRSRSGMCLLSLLKGYRPFPGRLQDSEHEPWPSAGLFLSSIATVCPSRSSSPGTYSRLYQPWAYGQEIGPNDFRSLFMGCLSLSPDVIICITFNIPRVLQVSVYSRANTEYKVGGLMDTFRIPGVLSCREAWMSLLLSVIAFVYALMLFVIRAPYNFTIIYYTPKFDQAVLWYVDSIPFVPSDSSDLPAFLVQPILSLCLFSAPKFYG